MKNSINRRSFLKASVLSAAALAACGSKPASSTPASSTPASSTPASSTPASSEAVTYKVGVIKFVKDASLDQIEGAILDRLAEKGKELGVTFEVMHDDGNADGATINQILTNQINNKAQLLIPIATPAAIAAVSATEDHPLPIVYSAVSDPVGAGLTGLENVTGTSDGLDTTKVFNLILAANPGIQKIGLLYDEGQDASTAAIAAARDFCKANNIETVDGVGTNTGEVLQAVANLISSGVEAVFTPTDNTIMTAEMSFYQELAEAKIPHYAGADSFALNGAFVGYGVDYYNLGVVTADLAVEILTQNKKAGDIDFVTFDNGTCTINTETCAAIGFDLADIKQKFEPNCLEIKETVFKENFD